MVLFGSRYYMSEILDQFYIVVTMQNGSRIFGQTVVPLFHSLIGASMHLVYLKEMVLERERLRGEGDT